MMAGNDNPLETYLTDHAAGATGGVDLALRIASETRDTALGQLTAEVLDAIEADRDVLDELIENLGFSKQSPKKVAGAMAEKLSRLRMNKAVVGSKELSLLLELEALTAGVEAKRSMWQVLQEVAPLHPTLQEFDFEAMIKRAEDQEDNLETCRRAIAPAALGAT